MVLNRRIEDSSILDRPRFKIKQPLMEPTSGLLPVPSRNDKNIGKRWKLGNFTTNSTTTTTTTTTTTPSTTSAKTTLDMIINPGDGSSTVSNSGSGRTSGMILSSVTSSQQPTTHQKVRRILEEHAIWQEGANNDPRVTRKPRGRSLSSSSSSSTSTNPSLLGNYNIVASRGELSRGSFAVRETSNPLTGNTFRKSRIDHEINGIFVNGREDSRSRIRRSPSNWEKRAANRDNHRETGWKSTQNSGQFSGTLPKSSSVPANLKSVSGCCNVPEGCHLTVSGNKNPGNGILRKSSAFLASLTQSGLKNFNDRKNNGNLSLGIGKEKSRFSLLRKKVPFVTNRRDDSTHGLLSRSPSCQNISNSGKKKNVSRIGVKKSVSFSSDTSFEEKRAPFRKTAVHEAKVYRKGVLRDINATEKTAKKVSSSWESPSGDPEALLRASREADDHDLRDLVERIQRSGLGQTDVNATDASGRTAISYLAGNGSPAMLEAALSFTGCNPNLPDNEGNTPLHFAAQAGQTECLNILLQRCPGIEVDARNILGFTPLMKAALQGRTKCAKILLFAGANPTMRDHGRGLRAEQWARYCGRFVCADVIERFARHRLLEKNISCRWGSEPELATKVLQGKVIPVPPQPQPPPSTGFRSKIKRVFRTTSGPDRSFSLVSQLTNAALCASTPALPKPGEISPSVKSLSRPLSVPQLRVTLVGSQEIIEKRTDKYGSSFTEKIESSIIKPPRSKKKNK